jgi:predicted transposase YdaD
VVIARENGENNSHVKSKIKLTLQKFIRYSIMFLSYMHVISIRAAASSKVIKKGMVEFHLSQKIRYDYERIRGDELASKIFENFPLCLCSRP